MDYTATLEEWKKHLSRVLDLVLKYIPSKEALEYKEKIAELKDKNTDLQKEITLLAMKTVGNEFEEKARNVAMHFSEVSDRISNGDIDYTDLMSYCDTDKMMKDAEEKIKEELKRDPDAPKTIVEMLIQEKPGIEFDENDKTEICNELVARGHLNLLNYFDTEKYLKDCFAGKIDLTLKKEETRENGAFYSPEYDRTLIQNLDKTILQGKDYVSSTVKEDIDAFETAYEDSTLVIQDALQKIYVDRNVYIENMEMTEDNFFIYADVSFSNLVNDVITFTYDKETHEINISDEELKGFDEKTKDAIYNKCYDAVDSYIIQQEYEFEQQQAQREQEELEEDDPYAERSLF